MGDEKKGVVHIRVEADYQLVEQVATQIGELLVKEGFEFIEQTSARPCRWEQDLALVFLTVR
jgi:hypothetical protein